MNNEESNEDGNEFEKNSRKKRMEKNKGKKKTHYLDSDSVRHDKKSNSRKSRRKGREIEIPEDEDDYIYDYIDEKMD
jgi:hypothetical protein